tara:strand:+ start:299 stop:1147 length:849 start_codon:yes stop_codon:yes gene_type:complete
MGKKYLDTKKGSLEQSILGVWQMAAEEMEVKIDGRTKKYREHRAKLETARQRREATGDKEKYQKFFNAAMKKFGVDSPADFKSDAEKKKFFNYVDKNYKGDHEEEVQKLHKELFGLEEGPFSSKSSKIQTKVAPAVKTFKGKGKKSKKEEVKEGKMSQLHQLMKDGKTAEEIAKIMRVDAKTIKKLMAGHMKDMEESYEIGTDEYRKHTENVTPGEDGEWVDAVNKKNDSMREALAKVWGVSENKNPFEKKSLTKEVKNGKTMTGKKIAKVDVKPMIKEKAK